MKKDTPCSDLETSMPKRIFQQINMYDIKRTTWALIRFAISALSSLVRMIINLNNQGSSPFILLLTNTCTQQG